MKIFESGDKVNFVDANNCFVGYDTNEICCETAGWFISAEQETNLDKCESEKTDVDAYAFDPDYFEEVETTPVSEGWDKIDEGGMVRYRLVANGKPDLYLHLFNA